MTRRLAVALLVLLSGILTLAGPAAEGSAASGGGAAVERVVVVGVPGLRWTDITASGTPRLWAAAEEGSIGALTVRAARSTTCVLDGWVTLGAGNRARFVEPPLGLDEQPAPDPELPGAEPAEQAGCYPQEGSVNLTAVVAALDADPDLADDNSYGAEPGALGAAVPCSTGVGRGPVLSLHRPGAVTEQVPNLPVAAAGWADVVARCPLTVVALPELLAGTDRRTELAALDARFGLLRQGLPEGTDLIVVGTSETGLSGSSLHIAIEVGPGVDPGFLRSASTGRSPFVQLIDVAPTVLARLGLPAPAAMAGQPFQPGQERPADPTEAVADLIDADLAARSAGSLTPEFFLGYVVATALLCLAGVVLLRRPRAGRAGALRSVALAAAVVPAATFLVNLVPWWRADSPGTAVAVAVVVVVAVATVAAERGPWGRRPFGPIGFVAALTCGTLAADVLLLGSRLQLSSLLGYSPIVAGRFTGFGNIPFGLYATGALLVTALVLRTTPPRHRRWVLPVLAAVVIVLDGAPGLGSDFGGVLALVPAFAVFAMVSFGIRLNPVRLALAGAAGAVVVLAIATLDHLRPADQQTHLGRFVGQLLDGSAGIVVQRKAQSNLDILTSSPLSLLVPVFAVVLWLLLRADGPLAWVRRDAMLRAGLIAVAVALGVGFLVNDSGVAVPVAGGWLAVPLALALAAGRRRPTPPTADPEPRPAGVTVNSRDAAARSQ